MKKHIMLIVFIFTFCAPLSANTWTKTYGGTSYDRGASVQPIAGGNGGFIITGNTRSFSGNDSDDVYLIRTDSLGDTLWTKTFGGNRYDAGNSVQLTKDGGFIIAGYTTSFGAGNEDVYLIRTDSLGDTLWTKTFGDTALDEGYSVEQTKDGGYVIAGWTDLSGAGNYDVYLIRTDSSGDTMWTKTYGGTAADAGYSVHPISGGDSGFIISGSTSSFGDLSGAIYLIRTNSSGDTLWTRIYDKLMLYDIGVSVEECRDKGFIISGCNISFPFNSEAYIIRTDSYGDTMWTRAYKESSPITIAYSVQECSDNGFIITGEVYSSGPSQDVYLVRMDSLGDTLWTKTFGGTGIDRGESVRQTSDNGYIIAGTTYSFGLGAGDVWLIKTDSTGNVGIEEKSKIKNQISKLEIRNDKIYLEIGDSRNVELKVYDLCGRFKETVYEGTLTKGNYSFTPKTRTSGIYFVTVSTSTYKETQKLILLK